MLRIELLQVLSFVKEIKGSIYQVQLDQRVID